MDLKMKVFTVEMDAQPLDSDPGVMEIRLQATIPIQLAGLLQQTIKMAMREFAKQTGAAIIEEALEGTGKTPVVN